MSRPARVRTLISVGIVGAVLLLQATSGYFGSELARSPDEGAHFTSGVLVFDYLRSGFERAPLDFALDFYQRYPKVAIGHFPPLFYVLQGVWYLGFGAHPWALILLVGAITAATACLLFQLVASRHGFAIGLITTALLVLNPLVRTWTLLANSDMLLVLLSFIAIRAVSRFLSGGSVRDFAAFALWTVLAVATKWNGLALLLVPPIAVVLAREFTLLRNRRAWIAFAALAGSLVLCAVLAVALGVTGFGSGYSSVTRLADIALHPFDRLFVLGQALQLVSPLLLVFAVVGAVILFGKEERDRDARIAAAVTVAWIVAVLVFHVVSPVTGDARYLLPCVVAAHLLFADGGSRLRGWLGSWTVPALVTSAAVIIVSTGAFELPLRTGYGAAARSLPTRTDGPTVVLIASDAIGEGAFVAMRLDHDTGRDSFVVRGYNTLAEDTWQGDSYRLRLTSEADIRAYLQRVPVQFVVVDMKPGSAPPPHIQLLHEALRSAPSNFIVQETFPLHVDERTFPDALIVYKNISAASSSEAQARSAIPLPRGRRR